MKEFLKKFNSSQKEVVEKTDGSILLIAGPGSGKTQVLTGRIAYMLDSDQGIEPNMILALTFTDAGVIAMRKRLVEFIDATAYKVAIHTFHSFCNEIIQSNPDYFGIRDFEPVSELERIEIAYKVIENLANDHPLKRLRGNIYYDSRRLLSLFQLMKDENWDYNIVKTQAEAYIEDLPNREEFIYKRGNSKKGIEVGDVKAIMVEKEQIKMNNLVAGASLLTTYDQELKKAKRYDFSDMIQWVLKAWQTDDFFLINYQERYQYLLVDEFQDTNKAQFDLLDKLMDYWDDPNIFAVGDDDQCLYEFNGARIANIVEYKNRYNPDMFVLNKNYRSNNFILEPSANVIDLNDDRLINYMNLNKDLEAAREVVEWDVPVMVTELSNTTMETCYIIDLIESMTKEGYDASKIGIIYRKHRQAEDLIRQFEARSIPYKVKKSINVLETIIIRQLLDLLSFIVNHDELRQDSYDSLLFKILHFAFFNNDYQKVHRYYLLLQDKDSRSRKPIDIINTEKILGELIKLYHNVPIVSLINHILEDTGIMKYVLKSDDYIQKIQYINTFFNWVKAEAFKRPDLTGEGLIRMIDKMKDNGLYLPVVDVSGFSTGVNLMTVHGAKGLEFEWVIMMGCTRNEWEGSRAPATTYKLPDTLTKSVKENKLESNRRLFYVGMTRAINRLTITYATKNNEGKNLEPSQFIIETGLDVGVVPEVDLSNYLAYHFKSSDVVLNIEESIIKDRLENFALSLSAMNKYLRCPVQFYYENVIRVPFVANIALVYGNGVHIALKKLFDEHKNGSKLGSFGFFDVFKSYMNRNLAQITEQEYQLRMLLGRRSLLYYYDEIYPSANKVTLNEFKINRVVVDGIPAKGDIDKMEFEGRYVDVVDYKTGNIESAKKNAKGPSEKEPYGGDYWRQGVFYEILLDHFPGKDWYFRSYRIDALGDNEFESIPIIVEPEDKLMVRKLMVETYNNIKALKFQEGCGEKDCIWCNLLNK